MTALALTPARQRLVPAVPPRPRRDLSLLRMALALRTNSLAAWPDHAYDDLILHRRFLGTDCFLLNDPAAARRVLAERAEAYVRPVATLRLLHPGTGDGLLMSEGEVWRAQRKLVAPHFAPQHVERLMPALQASANAMTAALPASGLADLSRAYEGAAIDTIGRALFSTPLTGKARRIGDLLRFYFRGAARGTVWDFLARRLDDHGWALRARRSWSRDWFAEVDALIAERAARPSATGNDLFDVLAAQDPAGLRDQVATMLATGFESTARLMFWASFLLAQDQDEQDAVRAELLRTPPQDAATLDTLKAWPRLARVLQETMRLYPPVSTIMRTAREADTLTGVPIKPGAIVIVCPWVMHRHRAHWDQPDAFMPERFTGRTDLMRGGAYLPFGMGRRVCIGGALATTEATLMLAHVLTRFRIALDTKRPVLPVAVATTVPDHEPLFRLDPVAA